MKLYYLILTLHSDTHFGRGDGIAGELDQEVQHDLYGCPYLGGKALKGMLVNECADILDALPSNTTTNWTELARTLFGEPGSTHNASPRLRVGDAKLPGPLRLAIQSEVDATRSSLQRADVLDALTTRRHQTAIDQETDVAKDSSLRSARVIIRETSFIAPLYLQDLPDGQSEEHALMLLAATTKALRRVGTNRNRGLGRLKATVLCDAAEQPLTDTYFERFCREVQP